MEYYMILEHHMICKFASISSSLESKVLDSVFHKNFVFANLNFES